MSSLKKGLKGMFKREKKDTYEKDRSSTQLDDTVKSRDWATTPAKIPPVQSVSPPHTSDGTDSSKPLPPTHPLATGQHSEPQEAVPQNHDAKPGPPSPIDTAAATSTNDSAVKPVDTLPSRTTTGNDDTESSAKVATPTDNAALPATGAAAADASQAHTESTLASAPDAVDEHATKVDGGINGTSRDLSSNENIQPQEAVATDAVEASLPIAHEEPPPIKAIKVAPGMSATSGPLEDFPEGGEVQRAE